MIDYLIVGSGIAGICFAETVLQNEKTVMVLEDNSISSSRVAGGLYNPVILKRFSQVWMATEQLDYGLPFYAAIAQRIDAEFDFKIPIYRKFASIEEQNNWFQAADKPNLAPYLSADIIHRKYRSVTADFGFGEVRKTGYVDTAVLLNSYNRYLEEKGVLCAIHFDHSKLEIHDDFVQYEGITARHLIFAEGFGMIHNPFFNHLPLDGTKGELLVIKAPELNLDVVLKSSVFILPIGNDLFKVGATYNWDDKTDLPTEAGKQELIAELKTLIDCDFEIVDHFAGVRPTVKDRRPLIGTHHIYRNIHLLNGLGTRGVMLGPFLACKLFESIENKTALDPQIDIRRFYKKLGIRLDS